MMGGGTPGFLHQLAQVAFGALGPADAGAKTDRSVGQVRPLQSGILDGRQRRGQAKLSGRLA